MKHGGRTAVNLDKLETDSTNGKENDDEINMITISFLKGKC